MILGEGGKEFLLDLSLLVYSLGLLLLLKNQMS